MLTHVKVTKSISIGVDFSLCKNLPAHVLCLIMEAERGIYENKKDISGRVGRNYDI